jgi:hypothetical protein
VISCFGLCLKQKFWHWQLGMSGLGLLCQAGYLVAPAGFKAIHVCFRPLTLLSLPSMRFLSYAAFNSC